MKRFILITLALCLLSVSALAEIDLSGMSLEDLEALRSDVSARIVEILANTPQETPEGAIGTIAELFPDKPFAMCIRDELGKLSISQPVTQDELDSIEKITIGGSTDFGEVSSLEGISHLHNLVAISLLNSAATPMKELPEEIYSMTKLRTIYISRSEISEVSPLIGNLVNLKTLHLSSCKITTLPDELINCVSLENLDLSYTDITEVPAVLFAMPNVKVKMEGTGVK